MLDRLLPASSLGPDTIVRDGGALLLRRGGVLVRIRPGSDADVSGHEVVMARVLGSLMVPVTPLLDEPDQPWTVDGFAVSAWRWVNHGAAVSHHDLGYLARTLRERSAVSAGVVPRFDPLGAVRRVVAELGADEHATFVRRRAAELEEPYAEAAATDPLGRAVVHGDLHRDNVVWAALGPLLTDLELSGSGPPSYDAAPVVVAHRRYGSPEAEVTDFLKGFGTDPRSWPGFEVMVSVYELWVTAWAVGNRHRNESWAEEAALRVASMRDGRDLTWSLR